MSDSILGSWHVELTPEERAKFWQYYKEFCEAFTQVRVDLGLAGLKDEDIVETYVIPPEKPWGPVNPRGNKPYHKVYKDMGIQRTFWTKHHPMDASYTKTESGNAQVFEVPNQYQSLRHRNIIEPSLLEMYPWLKPFDLAIYTYRGEPHEEFYVNVLGEGKPMSSIYVPYQALFKGDYDMLVKRNVNYLADYCRRDGEEAGLAIWDQLRASPQGFDFLKLFRRYCGREPFAA